MANTFRIKEIPGNSPITGGGPFTFEWDAAHKNIPNSPWTFGIEQRTMRTDYPGSQYPSEQVLGARYTDFTLQGRFDDRYNFEGYAEKTRKELELLSRRGNLVQITFEGLSIQGLIKSVSFDYRRYWDIGYSIEVSPHFRLAGEQFDTFKDKKKKLDVNQHLVDMETIAADLRAAHAEAPSGSMKLLLFDNTSLSISNIDGILSQMNTALSVRFIASLDYRPEVFFRHLAALSLSLGTTAKGLLNQVPTVEGATSLYSTSNAKATFDFDTWAKEIAYNSRMLILRSHTAALDFIDRVQPDAKNIYRPQAGESLYAISNRFYGSPYAWRVIADRNNLTDFSLTGDELLIIPEITSR